MHTVVQIAVYAFIVLMIVGMVSFGYDVGKKAAQPSEAEKKE